MVEHHALSEKFTRPPFRVVMPGMFGEGKTISALRQQFGHDAFVFPSISGLRTIRSGTKDLNSHYRSMAQEILLQANGRNIWMDGHSLGGDEIIKLGRKITEIQQGEGTNIHLNFISVPGIGERGLGALANLFLNYGYINKHVTAYEQHVAYPLPESYYDRNPSQEMEERVGVQTVFRDSPEERERRRETFRVQLRALVPDDAARKQLVERLDMLDRQIDANSKVNAPITTLLEERQKLLHDPIQGLFHGKHIPDGVHEQFEREYRETKDAVTFSARMFAQALLGFARRVVTGIDKEVKSLQKLAKSRGYTVTVSLTYVERDIVVPLGEIPKALVNLSDDEIDSLPAVFYLQQLAHSSIGYVPDKFANIPLAT